MNWQSREGVYFSGHYRICRNSRGDFDVWYYSGTKNGILKRGFEALPKAQAFCVENEAREAYQEQLLNAVFTK